MRQMPPVLDATRRAEMDLREEMQYGFLRYYAHSQFNNQRIELEHALVLAVLLNRTLVVPPFYIGKFRELGWWPPHNRTRYSDVYTPVPGWQMPDPPAVAVPHHYLLNFENVPGKWITEAEFEAFRLQNPESVELADGNMYTIVDDTRYAYR